MVSPLRELSWRLPPGRGGGGAVLGTRGTPSASEERQTPVSVVPRCLPWLFSVLVEYLLPRLCLGPRGSWFWLCVSALGCLTRRHTLGISVAEVRVSQSGGATPEVAVSAVLAPPGCEGGSLSGLSPSCWWFA